MNNEPVAWMYRIKDTDNRWELAWNKPTTEELFDTEPLYTHPVKELTDEKEALKSLYDAVIRYENLSPFADTYAVESCEFQLHDAKEKARAILRKAQE